jgi:hypothetical protein
MESWKIGLIVSIAIAVVIAVTIATYVVIGRKKSTYMSRSTEAQELLFAQLVQKIAPVVKGRVFEKREIDDMLGGNPLYDQIVHYHFTTLLNRGELSVESLRYNITGRPNIYS